MLKPVAFQFKPVWTNRNDIDLKAIKSVTICIKCLSKFLNLSIQSRIGMMADGEIFKTKNHKCEICGKTL
jgi:hypothetical protein